MVDEVTSANRVTLGVVAISRNEEKDMRAFLAHLLPWVDEIIVVDDQSTDSTTDIIRAAGPKVKLLQHRMSEEQGFAGQRNAGIEAATADWLLHMDIDERVTPALAYEMLRAIQDETKNAYRYHLHNFFLHRPMRGGSWQSWNKPWLVRRGKHHFRNRVHEECIVDGASETIGQLTAKMWHLNDENYRERMRKSMQYCELEADRILERGCPVQWYDFVVRPGAMLLRRYILQQGFRDGVLGLISAIHSADAVFRAYVLAWDKQHDIPRSQLEQEILEQWSTFDPDR